MKKLISFVTLLLFMFSFVVSASAEGNGSQIQMKSRIFGDAKLINKEYSSYMFNVRPSQHLRFPVYIQNTSSQEAKTTFYVTDAKTALNGGKMFGFPNDKNTFVGSWFEQKDFIGKEVTLQPRQTIQYMLDMDIPKDLKAGQYIGYLAIFEKGDTTAQKGNASNQQSTFQFINQYKMGIQVILNYDIKDAKPNYDVNTVKYSETGVKPILTLNTNNNGTILVKPQGTLTVTTKKGENVFNSKINYDSVYPLTSGMYEFVLPKKLPVGDYNANVQVSYQGLNVNKNIGFKVTQPKQRTVKDMNGNTVHINANKKHPSNFNQLVIILGILAFAILVAVIFILLMKMRSLKKKAKVSEEKMFSKQTIDLERIINNNSSNDLEKIINNHPSNDLKKVIKNHSTKDFEGSFPPRSQRKRK